VTDGAATTKRSETPEYVRNVAAAAVANFLGVAPMFFVGALAVQIQAELDFGPAKLGIAVAVHRAATALLIPLVGRIVDALGASRALRVFAVLSAATFVTIALLVRSWELLVVAMAMGGAGQAISSPAANRLLARNIPARHLGRAFGFKQSGPPLATTAAGLSVPIIAVTLGWRAAFLMATVVSLTMLLLVRTSDDDPRRDADAARTGEGPTTLWGMVRPRRSRSDSGEGASPRPPLDRPVVIVQLALALGFATAASSIVASFFVLTAVAAGSTPSWAGFVLAAASAAAIVVRLLGGVWTDWRRTGFLRGCAILLFSGAGGLLLIGLGRPTLMAVGAVVTLAGAWGFHGIFMYALVRAYPEAPGRITGLVTPGAMIGSSIGQVLFGASLEFVGAAASWTAAAIIALIGGVLLLGLNGHIDARIEAGSR
jgi:MFS family permease